MADLPALLAAVFLSVTAPELPEAGYVISPGYDAFLLLEGLSGPDGLAVSPEGVLHVVEEGTGRVLAVSPDGTFEAVLDGLHSPEGICFDRFGRLYITEDVEDGRILRLPVTGDPETLAHATAPEGIAVTDGRDVFYSESSVQLTANPLEYWTSVSVLHGGGGSGRLHLSRIFESYSDLAVDQDGNIYAGNEMSAEGTGPGVVVLTAAGEVAVFSTGPGMCEGLSFQGDGGFPLLVAQESSGDRGGVLWSVDRDGQATAIAVGFHSLEDAAVLDDGWIVASDDGSGSLILLVPSGI
jgi:sugar lactone lactonase YvrE